MKRMILAFAAFFMMATATMAQKDSAVQQANRHFDRTEMIKNQSEIFAQRYGLDENQKAKLIELNTKYAGKLRIRGPRRGGNRWGRNPQAGASKDSLFQRRAQMRLSREQMEARMKEVKTNQEEYNKELKNILTDEQYTKYQADVAKRQQAFRDRRRGQRPQRNQE